ncbi:hypothetical protein [Metaclostridioides mangenotii]|nr:hypothetical protein [Clostridioides mangenotii]
MNEEGLSLLQAISNESTTDEELDKALDSCDDLITRIQNLKTDDQDLSEAKKCIYIATMNTKIIVNNSGEENSYLKQDNIDKSLEKINKATEYLDNYNK